MNDANVIVDIICGYCPHHWTMDEQDFKNNVAREGWRWECPECGCISSVYLAKFMHFGMKEDER